MTTSIHVRGPLLWRHEGAFIEQFGPWDWFATLTLAVGRTDTGSMLRDVVACLSGLACRVDRHLRHVVAVEPHLSGDLHAHVLMAASGGASDVSIADIAALWRLGRVEIDICRGSGDASWYVTKHVDAWQPPDVACPRQPRCRRRHGCLVRHDFRLAHSRGVPWRAAFEQ